MRRLIVFVLLLSCLIPAWADDPADKTAILVAGQTTSEPQAKALFDTLIKLRNASHVDKSQLPLILQDASQISVSDYERLGFSTKYLPCTCVVRMSSSGNLEKVLLGPGGVPAIIRSVKHPTTAASLIFARWAQMTHTPVDPDLELLATAFTPGKKVFLVVGANTNDADRLAIPLRQLATDNHLTDRQLPILETTMENSPLLEDDDFQRLGFGADSLPCVCLIQMTEPPSGSTDRYFEAGHPGRVVDGIILRNVGNADWAAHKVLRQWAQSNGVTLAGDAQATPTPASAQPTPVVMETLVAGGVLPAPPTPTSQAVIIGVPPHPAAAPTVSSQAAPIGTPASSGKGPELAILLVGNTTDARTCQLELQVRSSIERERQQRGLADKLPIVSYHVDVPQERDYCQKLGIATKDVLYVALFVPGTSPTVIVSFPNVRDTDAVGPLMQRAGALLH